MYRFSILLMVMFLLSCEKVEFSCDYSVKTYIESSEGSEEIAEEGVLMHVFYADTALWEVANYADAVAGVLTGRKSNEGSTKMADKTIRSNSAGVGVFSSLDQESVIMIACEETSKRYAWRVAEVYRGLENVTVSIIFQLWQRVELYDQKNWVMVDDFLADRTEEYQVNAYVESVEDGEVDPIAGVAIHAFYADTLVWEVKNYADALSGKITKRDGSGETMSADISVHSDTHGLGLLYIGKKPVMIVGANDTEQYGLNIINDDTDWKKTSLVFQPWRVDKEYVKDDWSMVNEHVVEEPEVPEEPEVDPTIK